METREPLVTSYIGSDRLKSTYVLLAGAAAVLHCSRVERLFVTSAANGERTAVRQAGYPASVVDIKTWRTVPSSSFAITFTRVGTTVVSLLLRRQDLPGLEEQR